MLNESWLARSRSTACAFAIFIGIAFAVISPVAFAQQQTLILDNGFSVGPGVLRVLPRLDKKGYAGSNETQSAARIAGLDDGLRVTYVSTKRTDRQPIETPEPYKIAIKVNQSEVSKSDLVIQGGLGSAFSATPFDPFGRRIYMFQSPSKQIVQGITEVSPQYVRIQGLRGVGQQTSISWDMRVGMSSVPPGQLRDVLVRNADPNRAQDWLDIVSVYLAAKRYFEARQMLVTAIQRFPELETSRPEIKRIDQLLADQMFEAAVMAQNAGQHELAQQILKGFQANTVSVETQLKIDRRLEAISNVKKECDEILAWLREDLAKVSDPAIGTELAPILDEIGEYLNEDTRIRFADYVNQRTDPGLTADQQAALGFAGWLYGAGLAEKNLSVVRSGYIARGMITELLAARRKNDALIQSIMKLESGTPRYVARILENMPPAIQTPQDAQVRAQVPSTEDPQQRVEVPVPGRFLLEVPTSRELGARMVRYMVQLPAEYNPYRKYPCVLALPSEEIPFGDTLDWWTIPDRSNPQLRCYGEPSRNGYIVVSPEWNESKQPVYNYTENEHQMILRPLRDAMRRFSIDTDRIFVAGHFMGADAAWDLAFAHPDIWAGAIMIGAIAKKYIIQYWPNAKHIPTYFVNGEFDGENPMYLNASTWDNMLDDRKIDTMVTLYTGRGHDHFQEELPRIVQWMQIPTRKRMVAPDRFSVVTSRAGDRFFWWFETTQLNPDKLVHPLLEPDRWDEYEIEASLNRENNAVRIQKAAAKEFSIWLSPDMVDFSKKITIDAKGTTRRYDINGSTDTILQDVLGRADRQHPFWARIDTPLK
jgi:pimeloyl-ACP methyl ester carboxylesterase